MTSVTLPHARRPFTLSPRLTGSALGLALAIAVFALGFRLSPAGVALGPGLVALIVGAAAIAHALTGTSEEIRSLNRGLIAGIVAALLAFASGLSGETLEPLFGLAALTLLGVGAWRTASSNRAASIRPGARGVLAALALGGLLLAYNAWYVLASTDLEIADFMYFRLVSIAVASLIDAARLPQLVLETVLSLKADYSWLPGILPGAALAMTAPLSRTAYQAALMVFYAAPALIALGWLARELASRAGLAPRSRRSLGVLVLAVAAVAATYPTGIAVAARGMPDIGGLTLYVFALRTGDQLARAAASGRARTLTRRLALTLAFTLFAMFIFRRWYVFGAVGVAVALAVDSPLSRYRRRKASPGAR